ncbi:MAG TPA: FkbM family methyltransferase [Longimicrobium sp.]|jgi:FkbM family methyltransferase
MNFSAISNQSVVGRLLRLPLRMIPRDAHLPILQGPSRGLWWTVGSSNHGCWLGSYETRKRRAFEAHLAPGGVVYDVGANVGFYTLVAATKVGPGGRVVAFEPLPENLRYLRGHVRMNGLEQVTVFDAALTDVDGVVRFQPGESRAMGRIADEGLPVRAMRLDGLVTSDTIPPPDVVKIDVEGAEAAVLRGAREVLSTHAPTVFLATHGNAVHGECVKILREHGYEVRPLAGAHDELLATRRG